MRLAPVVYWMKLDSFHILHKMTRDLRSAVLTILLQWFTSRVCHWLSLGAVLVLSALIAMECV